MITKNKGIKHITMSELNSVNSQIKDYMPKGKLKIERGVNLDSIMDDIKQEQLREIRH